jgi:hypothetical protein
MKKKKSKNPRWRPLPVCYFIRISRQLCFLEKKFRAKLQSSKEKINEKIQDGGHFQFSYILETMRLREKLFKQKVTQMTRYE